MTIPVLRRYLDLCKMFNIEPTLKGANKFKENALIIDNLLNSGFRSLVIDIVK
ncbi:hypothetical protein [Clostridium thermobutyricum]|uniref:Uncharacterized protein n=1 Tax=Clostridium thermobutyricum DSM 4928 TaxID=1121339 RepID=A0A1V4SUB9_9CLOT|nr:hypothetical protein [Clostridium thermobutyricum]OPX47487.1 hypothetical protein CLTHE_18370 [Clostridium thermobutyricum DSM 4928]